MTAEDGFFYRLTVDDASIPVIARGSDRVGVTVSRTLDLDVAANEAATRYRPSAILPHEHWQPIDGWTTCTGQELQCGKLFVGVLPGPFQRGGLEAIAQEVRDSIESAISSGIPPVFSDQVREAEAQLLLWASAIDPRREIIPVGFNMNCGGRRSLTADQKGFHLGLHLDSWDGPSFAGREARTNRVSLNFGPGTRHFYFMLVPVWSMRKALNSPGELDVSAIINSYMRLPIDHHVFRLTVPPGAVYVAPTECLVHDASTLNSDKFCVTYTIRGHFPFSFRYWQQ